MKMREGTNQKKTTDSVVLKNQQYETDAETTCIPF